MSHGITNAIVRVFECACHFSGTSVWNVVLTMYLLLVSFTTLILPEISLAEPTGVWFDIHVCPVVRAQATGGAELFATHRTLFWKVTRMNQHVTR